MRRNPLLSMWLSGANAVWGAARGHAAAEMRRQGALVVAQSTRQVLRFWGGGAVAPSRAPRRTRRKLP